MAESAYWDCAFHRFLTNPYLPYTYEDSPTEEHNISSLLLQTTLCLYCATGKLGTESPSSRVLLLLVYYTAALAGFPYSGSEQCCYRTFDLVNKDKPLASRSSTSSLFAWAILGAVHRIFQETCPNRLYCLKFHCPLFCLLYSSTFLLFFFFVFSSLLNFLTFFPWITSFRR
jgi:hypothetical protein